MEFLIKIDGTVERNHNTGSIEKILSKIGINSSNFFHILEELDVSKYDIESIKEKFKFDILAGIIVLIKGINKKVLLSFIITSISKTLFKIEIKSFISQKEND